MNGTPVMHRNPQMNGTPEQKRDRAPRRRRQWQAHQAKLEREIETFFRAAGVKNVDLSEMFEDFEWL